MLENPSEFERDVHVVVRPLFDTYDSEGDYYVRLRMRVIDIQSRGERFLKAARGALRNALENGEITVRNDNLGGTTASRNLGDSVMFMNQKKKPEEIELTPIRRFVDSDDNPLTDFGIDTTISPTNI